MDGEGAPCSACPLLCAGRRIGTPKYGPARRLYNLSSCKSTTIFSSWGHRLLFFYLFSSVMGCRADLYGLLPFPLRPRAFTRFRSSLPVDSPVGISIFSNFLF